jgi:hypothetical protein
MPFIVAKSSSIQNGSVMVTDLFPNQSQANPAIDPQPQGPFYVRAPEYGHGAGKTPLLNSTSGISFASAGEGLVSYLLRRVADHNNGGGSLAITLANAIAIAEAIQARLEAGQSLTDANLNALVLAEVGNASDFDGSGSDSSGDAAEVLAILAGETYLVSAGTQIETALGAYVPVLADAGFQGNRRSLVDRDSSWRISRQEGVLGGLETAGIVTLYNSDGTLA